jgi:DNA repair exonuclease SbcCD nuclease subunit
MTPHDNDGRGNAAPGAQPLVVAHSSDLHLGARGHGEAPLPVLRVVLEAAYSAGAHALVLAGDVFDSNRVPEAVVASAAELLLGTPLEVVVLPGNHDPATADSVYRRAALTGIPNLHVLGVNADGVVRLPVLDLEVTGAAHTAYADMSPLPSPAPRGLRWRIVVAHGHWVTGPYDAHRGWLMHDHEIAAIDADYIALGHWERAVRAGDGLVQAYYSGSPELAKSVNIIRMDAGGVDVRRHPLGD